MKKPTILVALSGGVDSSMAAILLKEQGYNLVGVTFKVSDNEHIRESSFENALNDAKILATKINIPYYVVNIVDDFEQQIINYFINEYSCGRTPNPCALCNYQIKWSKLIELANELGCEYVATGHYATVKNMDDRYFISEAEDNLKDQTSFLWRLSQEYLQRTLFPLGEMTKSQVKELAENKGFNRVAKKQESYNICFIPNGDYRKFLAQRLKENRGQIMLADKTLLGHHNGFWNYTLGQKKGIGLKTGADYCVTEIDVDNNRIIVGNQDELLRQEIIIDQLVFQKYTRITENINLKAKIKYRGELLNCEVKSSDQKQLIIKFQIPVNGLVPGQSIVLFEGNDLVAGGVITGH